MNARYQKHTGPEGKTRKSAAAAKPSKTNTGSGSKSSAKSKSSGGSALAMRNPDTAEFRAVRKQWWIFLVAGIVLVAISYGILAYVHTPWARTAYSVVLGLSYAAIIYAFFIDWTKMRPLRKAAFQQAKSGKTPKEPKAE